MTSLYLQGSAGPGWFLYLYTAEHTTESARLIEAMTQLTLPERFTTGNQTDLQTVSLCVVTALVFTWHTSYLSFAVHY